jgi:hypothetical protein
LWPYRTESTGSLPHFFSYQDGTITSLSGPRAILKSISSTFWKSPRLSCHSSPPMSLFRNWSPRPHMPCGHVS